VFHIIIDGRKIGLLGFLLYFFLKKERKWDQKRFALFSSNCFSDFVTFEDRLVLFIYLNIHRRYRKDTTNTKKYPTRQTYRLVHQKLLSFIF